MIVGAVVRIELLSGPQAFYLVLAAVLVPIGGWLVAGRQAADADRRPDAGDPRIRVAALLVASSAASNGIGGGSLLAPGLVGLGFPVAEVAPAALASTFLTSIVGVLTYALISLRHGGPIAPDWPVGIAIGLGGLIGGYVGTGLRSRVPEAALRKALGVVAIGLGARYLTLALI